MVGRCQQRAARGKQARDMSDRLEAKTEACDRLCVSCGESAILLVQKYAVAAAVGWRTNRPAVYTKKKKKIVILKQCAFLRGGFKMTTDVIGGKDVTFIEVIVPPSVPFEGCIEWQDV